MTKSLRPHDSHTYASKKYDVLVQEEWTIKQH